MIQAARFPWPRSARWALALWCLLAVVVFSVRFDWNTRMAGHAFVRAQIARQRQGVPVQTINEGFRPMVRDAAIEAARWLVLIAAAGAVLTAGARRQETIR
jgi:hypothetical protein